MGEDSTIDLSTHHNMVFCGGFVHAHRHISLCAMHSLKFPQGAKGTITLAIFGHVSPGV